ncbi:molybdopterin-dependent oxidoreductase [Salicibibacter cibarius]|uniref:Molybdopterin-dependent oxidoreductase n=1 Tax=Salicibibacter cibarius TaxID=2743000 RepID=A0A7T6Z0G8_9BACI|nr:molybdopterin-dependent oxidoreductase [Salicibibacter cibarius]QQK74715.1 molybdopterin-dependent oxidoreductase [Salicibibacter cibarius]
MKSNKAFVATHWGSYQVKIRNEVVENVQASRKDSNPSFIGELLYDITDSDYRIAQPMVRAGYLKGDANHRQSRGKDSFVPVSWEEGLDLAASALKNAKDRAGNRGIYGGSYGWASAGRFHHAISQVKRFLNTIGGFTSKVNSYSAAAAEVITPHVIGSNLYNVTHLLNLNEVAKHGDFLIAFGGINEYNNQVVPGGVVNHRDRDAIERLIEARTEVISISPLRSDTPSDLPVEWMTPRPCTDVAIMLAIAHYLETENKVDLDFIDRYTVGYDKFKAYLLGRNDGIAKDSAWAAIVTGISADDIKHLAAKFSNARCPVIQVTQSVQRSEHGEQSYWLAITLAAMVGSIGKPGGGVGLIANASGFSVHGRPPFKWESFPQGENPVSQSIPVARIADMLLNPGESYTYNGELKTYPDIELIYWAGGNPFHHHQDLNKLRRAWRKPETVIVNESVWTATARHADIVFPVTTFLERNDFVCGWGSYISPSKKALENYGQSRNDFEIFCGLAERLGVLEEFSEGLDEMTWLETLYQDSRSNAKEVGIDLPPFDEFWEKGEPINFESQIPEQDTFMSQFRRDPQGYPLSTPSGKIEIYSSTIDSFGYSDCGGYPQWYDKRELLGGSRAKDFPLHMISHQPRNKLHSQLDFGKFSRKDKTNGRETVTLNPTDASARGIEDGMIVRIFNDRGACLAGARLSHDIMRAVIAIPTGAWYCPDEVEGPESLEYHGNPNALTLDLGTSSLAQGSIAHSCLVDIEPFYGFTPEIDVLLKPRFTSSTDL